MLFCLTGLTVNQAVLHISKPLARALSTARQSMQQGRQECGFALFTSALLRLSDDMSGQETLHVLMYRACHSQQAVGLVWHAPTASSSILLRMLPRTCPPLAW